MKVDCVYNTKSGAKWTDGPGEHRPTQPSSVAARCIPSPDTLMGNVQSQETPVDTATSSQSPRSESDTSGGRGPLSLPGRNQDPKMLHLNSRIKDLERVFRSRALDHAGEREIYSAQPMLRDGRAAVNKTRIFGRSNWLNTAYQFSEMQDLFGHLAAEHSPEVQSLRLEIDQLLIQCKHSARVLKSCRPSRCFPPAPITTLAAPSRDLAEQMGQVYFARFESAFRILHVPTYWLEFNQFYDGHEMDSLTTLLKIRLVTAIGLGLQPEYESSHQARATASQEVFFAQSWISGLVEKDRLSVDGIQIQCLLILARQTLAIGGDLIWISVGTLQRSAMQMGLHRDPKHFPEMPFLLAEIRRRLWATILEMSVQSALDSGMPPMISLGDYDTAYPLEINDDEIKEELTIGERRPKCAFTDVSLQLILLKAVPIRLQILRSVNGLGTEMFYDEVLEMTIKLERYCDQCLVLLQSSKGADGCRFKSTMAEIHLKRFLLILHAPFAVKARANQAFRSSLEVYLSSALVILAPNLDPDLERLFVVGGGIFKTCAINAALIASNQMIAVAETETHQSKPRKDEPAAEEETLRGALEASMSLAEKRLCSGETNVRLYTTLHMARGHVTALENGASVPLTIAQHAKMALEQALVILKAQYWQQFPVAQPFDGSLPMSESALDDYTNYMCAFDLRSTYTTW